MKAIVKKISIAVAVAAFAGAAVAEDTELVVVSWGGAYTASQQKAYHDPYMALNPGTKILIDNSGASGLAKLREQAKSGKITWSLVDMVASDAIAACEEGLVEKIDHDAMLAPAPDGTTASEDFGDMIVAPCFAPEIVYSTTFGYRKDKFLYNEPKTIADVFDLEKFPGRRALERRPQGNLEWALIADGVSADDVYEVLSTEEGRARAFKKLDTIKSQVVWWKKGSMPTRLLADDQVVISSAYNGRLFTAIEKEKQPLGIMWDWQVFDLDGWVVPKGAPHKEETMKYLRFATDTQRLADQAKYISYGPARKSSAPLVGKHAELNIDMLPHMPTAPANSKNRLLFNYKWWAANKADIDKRFNAWLSGS